MPGQKVATVTRPDAGMDSYTPPSAVNDNVLTDMYGVSDYRGEALEFGFGSTPTEILTVGAENEGYVTALSTAFERQTPSATTYYDCFVIPAIRYDLAPTTLDKIYYTKETGAPGSVDVSALLFAIDGTGSMLDQRGGCCMFRTEAKTYYIAVTPAQKKLLTYDFTTAALVTIPFYPKKIVSHMNRLFAIDTGNKFWWSDLGKYDTWYGGAVAQGYVAEATGYWTIESEARLIDIESIGGMIVVFASSNIYKFQGYNDSTFQFDLMVSGVGADSDVTVSNGIAYFIFRGEAYELMGSTAVVVSRPITVNGSNANAVLGGITIPATALITATKDYLYIYDPTYYLITAGATYDAWGVYTYKYDIKKRSWWKSATIAMNFVPHGENYSLYIFIIPYGNRSSVYMVTTGIAASSHFGYVYREANSAVTGMSSYITTKAFNTSPSEMETLTSVILQLKRSVAGNATILMEVSSYDATATWVTIYSAVHALTEDLSTISIPMNPTLFNNKPYYRLRLTITTTSHVFLYNIERHYRTRGMSR